MSNFSYFVGFIGVGVGYTNREIVALCGAHTLGRAFKGSIFKMMENFNII